MATLADIKTQLDALRSAEEKLEAFANAQQTDLASLKKQLLEAQAAGAADPAAIDAIIAEVREMQTGVAAALPAAPVVASDPPAATLPASDATPPASGTPSAA